ncbi:anaphase-promoting complex subunit, putative [Phytophthora infestans T30-4]|uniref:Anaphase-promoting complex subunit 2 n=1 Tax=Phytophthora infestans (strain T30-4) TaxID=403677 RepID=D0N4D6_PHYIT|nr:anaphase-promoting complex subunit, putative [Phytophthora infestans T30-4]EEY69744.1 anaphase-promoting complex subunit, putative [Phytophthora infestans T30-4]|eukprot:XP_002998391.1 anaphase-promoting complex subunit, putative [Phytophthora infestans T30-4]
MSGSLHVDRELLWRKLFAFDHQPEDALTGIQDSTDHLCGVIQTAVAHGRHEPLRQMLLQRLGYWLRSDVVPPFWSFFDALPIEIGRSRDVRRGRRHVALLCAQQLTLALQFAEDAFAHCVQIASLFDDHVQLKDGQPTMLQELRTTFRCLVFEDTRTVVKFEELLLIFFSMSFQKFRGKEKSQTFDSRPIRQTLLQLEWLHVAEPALLRVLHSQIKKVVKSTCGEVYDELFLTEVEQWACSELLPWLEEIMQTKDEASTGKWREILSRHVRQEFGSQRIKQLFEIIKEFPDSVPALEDLRLCLERTQQHGELLQEFRGALQSRLLQPGANTSAILDIYVSTIKAFRLLDPKGVLLEALSCPVKEYLRKRKDTVRCIVQSLTDEQSGDLFEELRRDNMRIIQHDDDSDDDEDMSPDAWEPDPIEADPTKTSRSRSSDDILRILVNIYGSRDFFVNEYRMMLADKLLQNLEFDTDRDVQTLELLKLRFGEDSLQQCEIMVRDIEDSKRLNGNQFWPSLQGDDFVLHPKVSKDIDAFKNAYHVLRNPRSLEWNTSLGSVQLSIELEGEEREFNVSPLQATMILYFEEKDRWSVEELATKLEISADVLLKHVSLWVNHGLVSFASGRRELVASVSFQDTRCNDDSMVEELETAVSSDAQAEEDFKVLETYIVGMLSNFGSLSIQRIHNMLSTFARSGAQPYTKTISGLSVVLGKLVNTNKLEFVGGQYQLAK